jgi:hypothetical protein
MDRLSTWTNTAAVCVYNIPVDAVLAILDARSLTLAAGSVTWLTQLTHLFLVEPFLTPSRSIAERRMVAHLLVGVTNQPVGELLNLLTTDIVNFRVLLTHKTPVWTLAATRLVGRVTLMTVAISMLLELMRSVAVEVILQIASVA